MSAWLPPPPPAIVLVQDPQTKSLGDRPEFVCDESGVIRCAVVETVTVNRSAEDLRTIARFVSLVSERNRRFYLAWHEKLPSAAYEVVRRVRTFPYLPNGDMYAITDMQVILQEERNRIIVRYPRIPSRRASEWSESDYVVYESNLSAVMKMIEKEIGRLGRYGGSRD